VAHVDDLLQTPTHLGASQGQGQLQGFADEVLSALFAVKPQLCNQKFELKLNDVRFVSHPTLIPQRSGAMAKQQMLINIVFALHAQASYSIVKCYHELSKRLGLALKFEEQRSGYVTEQTAHMARTHDEQQQQPLERTLELIAERCSLAQALRSIFHDLCTTGLLSTSLNHNLTLCFCLPAKAHQLNVL